MPAKPTATDERAAAIVQMYEQAGKPVRRVVIEGKRVEVEFSEKDEDKPHDPQMGSGRCSGQSHRGLLHRPDVRQRTNRAQTVKVQFADKCLQKSEKTLAKSRGCHD